MISLLFLAFVVIERLLFIAAPIAFCASLLTFNRVRYIVNATGLILIAANLTTSAALLISWSGQDLVLIIALILSVGMIRSIILNSADAVKKRVVLNITILATLVFILPSFSFFFNSPGLLGEYVFWLKRALLVLFYASLGCFYFIVSPTSLRFVVVAVFLINCIGVVASYFAPELFLLFIDANDPMLEKGLNPIGGGFFLNPNGAALAVVFSYLGLLYVRHLIDKNWILFFSLFFILTLAITGSRGGFLCGIFILALSFKELLKFIEFDFKGLLVFVAALSFVTWALISLVDGESLAGFSRIVDVNNEGNLASNDSRLRALVSSLSLAIESPVIGSGFALRNKLLDTQPHNMYAAYAVDIGIIGILAFPLSIIFLIKNTFYGQDGFNSRVTIFALLFMGLFDHEIIYSKQFAYLLFVAFAIPKYAPAKFRLPMQVYR
jgi:hypothetical protein